MLASVLESRMYLKQMVRLTVSPLLEKDKRDICFGNMKQLAG